MKKVMSSHYSSYELFTRQSVFSRLTGALRFPEYDGSECDAVLLNFEANRFAASKTFGELERSDIHVIVYSDRNMNPVIINRLLDYNRCSLIICPEEYEVDEARVQFEKKCIYRTIAAKNKKGLLVPMANGSKVPLTKLQTKAIYGYMCGMAQKEIAAEADTTRENVPQTFARLRKMFGCESMQELIAMSTIAF